MTICRSEISDLYKEVYGTRPTAFTMKRIDAMSDEEYDAFGKSLMEELNVATTNADLEEKESVNVLNARLVGMMADYNISMSKAMEWDFETFGSSIVDLYEHGGEGYVQYEFEHYLWQNNVTQYNNMKHFTDIFLGRKNDFILVKK